MAGVMNNTARQFNLRGVGKNGHRVTVRIAPGFNAVNDEHWKAFVDGRIINPYVKQLKDKGQLEFGTKMDDMEMDIDPDTKSKSKSVPLATLKADLKRVQEEAKLNLATSQKANSEAETAKANEREALARAEKAELELATLKQANKKVPESKDKK